ncbi:MAG: acyltransferase [Bacteroidota bacterium]
MTIGSSTTEIRPQDRYQELDALRGVAALVVLLFHYSMNNEMLLPFFKYGVTGVDLFFLISGFVIFRSISNVKSGAEFLINRFCRLFPTYWVAVTFTFLIIFLNEHVAANLNTPINWEQYWYNMTMFQYYFNVPNIDAPYWTMIVEMVFYLTMFVLLISKSLRSTIPFFVMLVLFGLLLSEFYRGEGSIEFTADYFVNFPLAQYVALFLGGILFYQLHQSKKHRIRLILLIIGCYLAQIVLFNAGDGPDGHLSLAEYQLVLGIYFLLMFLFVFGKLSWLVNRYTLFLGKISFALYLIHQYFSVSFLIPTLTKAGMNVYVASYLIALPACLLVASAITFGIEKPVGPWLKKKLNFLIIEKGGNILKRIPLLEHLKN